MGSLSPELPPERSLRAAQAAAGKNAGPSVPPLLCQARPRAFAATALAGLPGPGTLILSWIGVYVEGLSRCRGAQVSSASQHGQWAHRAWHCMGTWIGRVVLDPRSSQNTLPIFKSQSPNHCGAAGRWAQSGQERRGSWGGTAEPPTAGRVRVRGPWQVELTRGSGSQGVAGVKDKREAALTPLATPPTISVRS